MKYFAILFLTVISVGNLFAQAAMEEHVIDRHLRACLDSTENQTTVGMTACAIRAGAEWDRELNKSYDLLISKLSADEKAKLMSAQTSWVLYRNKEMEFARAIYVNLQGTMWRIVLADRQTELTRQRTLELKAYYENLP